MMPSALRSSGIMPSPARMAAAGDQRRRARPSDADRSAVDRVDAEDRLRGLGAAGSEQSGQADDLAGVHVDGDVVEQRPAGEPLGRAGPGSPVASRCSSVNVVAPCSRTSSTSRPSMVATSRSRVVPATGPLCTRRPSRSTVTRSQKRKTSSSLCVT